MVNSYKIDAISIGNGTASRETEFLSRKLFDKPGFLVSGGRSLGLFSI
jgi:transcriptional accessory protein Tex/SPT6